MSAKLEIGLFGTCAVKLCGNPPVEIRGSKHRALICVLATAPLGRRTRTYLQTMLWGYAGYDCGHQNLRRALSDLRKLLGAEFDTLFLTTNTDIELNLESVRFIGGLNDGPFLNDLHIPQADFRDWVESIRANPAQIAALFSSPSGARSGRPNPRVIVLPLGYFGDDPTLRALGDWIGEQSCRILSRSRLLTVISHLSGRMMAAEPVVIANVKEKLDVDYVATGHIRRVQDGAVFCIDFIDALSGQMLWSREVQVAQLNDLEALNAQLVNIAHAIARAIAQSAIDSVRAQSVVDVSDHNLTIAGAAMMHRPSMRDFLKSREYLTAASERITGVAEPLSWIAKWHVLNVMKGFSIDSKYDTLKAAEYSARALDIDPESSLALTVDGFVYNNLKRDTMMSGQRLEEALQINPNESLAWLIKGSLDAFLGDGKAAVAATSKARSLSPIDPFGYYYDSLASTAHLSAGQYDHAYLLAERSLQKNSRHLSTHRAKITALHFLGRMDEARSSAKKLMERYPHFTLDEYRKSHPVTEQELGQRVITALSAAGIS
jgi:TolB-like protein